MATEIERKFLVKGEQWRDFATEGKVYRQGYIPTENNTTVRVRLVGEQGYLTLKGPRIGVSRSEYEYSIPAQDAREMLDNFCQRPLIEKTRYKIALRGLLWEVDEFVGENEGLILAEVELTDENQAIELPDWIGQDVSDESRYYNANLVQYPYNKWSNRHEK
ncbi:CYTH domain-containing protein [Coleofasciculus sp. LEGE 07081]|uniref:CYTH domain-containing protein n=1 Tax=unclassified Coleofasciculus TaxID=2692782 RepID=UPI00187FE205|nr:CYTH domain-containing protein [Coleofasciculus sp. LEGE 07081]MBE9152211.1 CYTH domain-containing protein [Coleofasciculus sp. LEGE 07092]